MHIAGSLEEQGRRTWGNIVRISNFEAGNVRSYDVDDVDLCRQDKKPTLPPFCDQARQRSATKSNQLTKEYS